MCSDVTVLLVIGKQWDYFPTDFRRNTTLMELYLDNNEIANMVILANKEVFEGIQ